jgi:hypothetical protein
MNTEGEKLWHFNSLRGYSRLAIHGRIEIVDSHARISFKNRVYPLPKSHFS